MTQPYHSFNTNSHQTINQEQFSEITEAILAGKYSWACFLLLRCVGYNPLHYIPYRTYNRLVKENCQISLLSECKTNKINLTNPSPETNSNRSTSRNHLSKINDLDYIDTVTEQHNRIQGGYLDQCLEYNGFKVSTHLYTKNTAKMATRF